MPGNQKSASTKQLKQVGSNTSRTRTARVLHLSRFLIRAPVSDEIMHLATYKISYFSNHFLFSEVQIMVYSRTRQSKASDKCKHKIEAKAENLKRKKRKIDLHLQICSTIYVCFLCVNYFIWLIQISR